jgi:hypothetical protein
MVDAGMTHKWPCGQIVMGIKNALPEGHLLELTLGEIPCVLPKAMWTAVGIGSKQTHVMEWALARGAHGVRKAWKTHSRRSRSTCR